MYYPSDYPTLPAWQQTFINQALDDGCYWINSGSRARITEQGEVEYSQILITPEIGEPDCMGRFSIGFDGENLVYYYERITEEPGSRTYSCGNMPQPAYNLRAMIDKANCCPKCLEYIGVDNMYRVGRDGRACSDCAKNLRVF